MVDNSLIPADVKEYLLKQKVELLQVMEVLNQGVNIILKKMPSDALASLAQFFFEVN